MFCYLTLIYFSLYGIEEEQPKIRQRQLSVCKAIAILCSGRYVNTYIFYLFSSTYTVPQWPDTVSQWPDTVSQSSDTVSILCPDTVTYYTMCRVTNAVALISTALISRSDFPLNFHYSSQFHLYFHTKRIHSSAYARFIFCIQPNNFRLGMAGSLILTYI